MPEWSDLVIRFGRRLVPICLCFAIAVASALPIGVGDIYTAVGPMTVFCLLFVWRVARPDDIPPWSVFLAGAVLDGLGGGPLGLWSLSFLVGYILVGTQLEALMILPRFVAWVAYAVISALTALVAWGIAAAYLRTFVDPLPMIWGCAVSIAVFPLLVWIAGRPVEDDSKRFERI